MVLVQPPLNIIAGNVQNSFQVIIEVNCQKLFASFCTPFSRNFKHVWGTLEKSPMTTRFPVTTSHDMRRSSGWCVEMYRVVKSIVLLPTFWFLAQRLMFHWLAFAPPDKINHSVVSTPHGIRLGSIRFRRIQYIIVCRSGDRGVLHCHRVRLWEKTPPTA